MYVQCSICVLLKEITKGKINKMHNVVGLPPTVGLAPTARYSHVYIHIYMCIPVSSNLTFLSSKIYWL